MSSDLSPAQYAASVGLSPEVLEQAAEAGERAEQDWWESPIEDNDQGLTRVILDAALPVLVPAIREALVREMIADIKGTVVVYGESKVELDHVIEWLARYLPAAEGGAS